METEKKNTEKLFTADDMLEAFKHGCQFEQLDIVKNFDFSYGDYDEKHWPFWEWLKAHDWSNKVGHKCECGETRPANNVTKFFGMELVPAHCQPLKCTCGKLWTEKARNNEMPTM